MARNGEAGMKTISSTTGYLVEELEEGVDTLDITVEAPALDSLADQWEALADTFAAGVACQTCRFAEYTWNIRRLRRDRECGARTPTDCPALNPVPAYLRRQAS
jgi:hypothetical protein